SNGLTTYVFCYHYLQFILLWLSCAAKQTKLKQAKEEAEKEIAQFRAQVEADFQRKVAESSGDSGANVKRLEQETDAKIIHLKTEASRISPDVVSILLRHVTTVKN
ncbi:hypothetical protein RD792_013401, partial [Penstemon davidsonii]